MYTRFVTWRLREKLKSTGKCEIRILTAQQSRGDGRDSSDTMTAEAFGGARRPRIFGVGDKCKVARPGFLDSGYPGYFKLGRSVFQPRSKSAGDLGKFHSF